MHTETRTQTIVRNTRHWAQGRDESIKTLAYRVQDIYQRTVPAAQRTHQFSNCGNALRDQHNNKKFIERCITGDIRFPADMEEAWVMALDNPYRSRLIAELAHRYGLMPVYESDLPAHHAALLSSAKLLHETSEALEVVAKMEMDGVINDNNFCQLQTAVSELDDVASCALTMKRLLAAKMNMNTATHAVHVRH